MGGPDKHYRVNLGLSLSLFLVLESGIVFGIFGVSRSREQLSVVCVVVERVPTKCFT